MRGSSSAIILIINIPFRPASPVHSRPQLASSILQEKRGDGAALNQQLSCLPDEQQTFLSCLHPPALGSNLLSDWFLCLILQHWYPFKTFWNGISNYLISKVYNFHFLCIVLSYIFTCYLFLSWLVLSESLYLLLPFVRILMDVVLTLVDAPISLLPPLSESYLFCENAPN